MTKERFRFNSEVNELPHPKDFVVLPKIDIIFKKFFSAESNINLLKDLISSALVVSPDSIEDLQIMNSSLFPKHLNEKFCHVDLMLQLDGKIIDIEMQVHNTGEYRNLSVYYGAGAYFGTIDKGDGYQNPDQVIVLSFLAYDEFPLSEGYKSQFGLLELTRHELLTDKLQFIYFEINKIPETTDERIGLWLRFLKAETQAELDEIIKIGDNIMAQAVSTIRQMDEDNLFREKARERRLSMADERFALSHAFTEGERKGEIKGKIEGKAIGAHENAIETAKKMLQRNFPVDSIKEMTNLDTA
ncbi:MAG: Rpn family recombination-promoting nuclease/putative transposase, partial [Oscillospiraceae bacterium]|nr:Rpn family recombination-promoting nuclease/putative transposase [Oscillospiraceae bacterium]